ncbi:MAG: dihydroneopterin aldolase family protein [Candidatus Lokiarchaeota archaeon]|jgi:hypothetical protein
MSINNYFSINLSKRERACFESGIKLGALYHILCGMPISSNIDTIKSIEKGIESSISCQPYVKNVSISLDKDKIIGDKTTEFAYDDISGKIINAEIDLEYESVKVKAKIKWIEDLSYPLMYIEKIY